MITAAKLSIYERFNGDEDGWSRSRTKQERHAMTDHDWADIRLILHRLTVGKQGKAAVSFCDETARMLAGKVEDDGVMKRLLELA